MDFKTDHERVKKLRFLRSQKRESDIIGGTVRVFPHAALKTGPSLTYSIPRTLKQSQRCYTNMAATAQLTGLWTVLSFFFLIFKKLFKK